MNEKPTLQKIFTGAARKLRAEYEDAFSEPHPAQRGQEREDILSEFLSSRLPRSIGLSKGHAIDDRDALSPQLDIMVFDALQTVLYRPNPGSTFIPYDSLLAWIEVKSKLTKRGLHDAFGAATKTKSLHRSQVMIGPNAALQRPTPRAFLFAFSSDLTMDALMDEFVQGFKNAIPGFQLDSIFVLDQFDLTLNIVVPGDSSSEPTCQHLFLQPQNLTGKSVLLPGTPGPIRFSYGIRVDLPSPSLIRVEAWQSGELTLWSFLRLLLNAVTPPSPFRPRIPWKVQEEFDWLFQDVALCLGADTPPEKRQEEADKLFRSCLGVHI